MLSRINRRTLVSAAWALGLLLALASVATACPTCKVALASHDASQGDIVSGIFWSILFMMSMPFTILALMVGYMYLLVRRARAAAAQQKDAALRNAACSTEQVEERESVGV